MRSRLHWKINNHVQLYCGEQTQNWMRWHCAINRGLTAWTMNAYATSTAYTAHRRAIYELVCVTKYLVWCLHEQPGKLAHSVAAAVLFDWNECFLFFSKLFFVSSSYVSFAPVKRCKWRRFVFLVDVVLIRANCIHSSLRSMLYVLRS